MRIASRLVTFSMVLLFAFVMVNCGQKPAAEQTEAPADSAAAPANEHPSDSAQHTNEHPSDSTK